MNIEQNQEIRSIGIISTVVLVAVCLFASAPVWNARRSEDSEKTMHRAESLAYQILEAQRAQLLSKAKEGRLPASEQAVGPLGAESGEISLDSWGRPFHFKLLKNEQQRTRVLVWSAGPNGEQETSFEKLDSNRDMKTPEFMGDDVGAMISIK